MHKLMLPVALAVLFGCSLHQAPQERRLSVLRPAPPERQVIRTEISRAEFLRRLQNRNLIERARLVEVFTPASEGARIPRYRIFGITPDSPYALLGVRNADILYGAHDRVLANGRVFKDFVLFLPAEKNTQIDLERDGKDLQIAITLTD